MARQAPKRVEVQEIHFKLHNKYVLFNTSQTQRSHVNLLAVASSVGLLFAGHPNAPELRVVMHKDLIEAQGRTAKLRSRSVALPGLPVALACSADGSMLAVNFMLNGAALLQIYSVASFTTPAIKSLYTIRLSAEEGVNAHQLLWNPVLNASLAVVLSNGALGMYTLKEGGQYEFHSLDKSQQVKCGCWSPKGKQIVVGFPNGRLQQFKPDLTPAKTIECPAGIHDAPFDTIALHWLSTFQFAAVFVQQGEDATPALYIVNAPKGGAPSYVNYYDICYSASGPRQHQVTFIHIAQWNLLLVVSANAIEVGVLGTNEAGDTPNWVQYSLNDQGRIELPLHANDETYPVGLALDTASTHRLVIDEQQVPVMPIIHVLATHGHLLSFNFLNLAAGAADICSPPPPVTDSSGQFRVLEEPPQATAMAAQTQPQAPAAPPATPSDNASFGFGASAATSTPAMQKEKPPPIFSPPQQPTTSLFGQQTSSLFGANAFVPSGATSKPSSFFGGFGLGGNTNPPPPSQFGAPQPAAAPAATFKGFSALGTGAVSAAPPPLAFTGFGGAAASTTSEAAAPAAQPQPTPPQSQPTQSQAPTVASEMRSAEEEEKPLYTAPSTFNPEPAAASKQTPPKQQQAQPAAVKAQPLVPSDEIDEVVSHMMAVQINAFSVEAVKLSEQSTGLLASLGDPAEMKQCTRRLNDLQEIIEQAADRDFEQDVQNMRHTLNESYAMLTECRSKLEMFHNPDTPRLVTISTFDPINLRQLGKLQSYLAMNEVQLQQVQQQIDEQWSFYQDVVRRNTRNQMHMPYLEGIYQRLTTHNGMLSKQRTKFNCMKAQLKQQGLLYKLQSAGNASDVTTLDAAELDSTIENSIDAIADDILSMSLSGVIDTKRWPLSPEKVDGIRELLSRQKEIMLIRPQRPKRVGLHSEIILEQKLQNESRARALAAIKLEKVKTPAGAVAVVTTAAETISATPPVTTLAKPTATKPQLPALQSFAPPAQAPSVTQNFNFGGTSPFVKPAAAAPAVKTHEDSAAKAPASSAPAVFATPPTFTGFGMGGATAASGGGFASTQPQPTFTAQTSRAAPAESLKEALAAPPLLQTPISFAAKVIGGDTAKPQATVPTSAAANAGFATLAATAQPKAAVAPVANKENKKPEEKPKVSFSFGGSLAANAADAPGANVASGGFFAKPAPAKPGNFAGLGASLGVSATSAASGGGTSPFGAPSPAFSFAPATAAKPETTAAEAASQPPSFAGFGKPVGDVVATSVAPMVSTASSSFSFGALNLSTSPTATTSAAAASATSAAPTATTAVSSTASSDSNDSLFASLSVCKPAAKEEERSPPKATTASNIFAGFGAGSSGTFSFASAGGESPFATKTSFFDSTASSFGKPSLDTAGTAAAAAVEADTPIAATTTTTTATEPAAVTSTTPSTGGANTQSTFTFSLNALGGSGAPSVFGSAAATPTTATPPSIFSAASNAAAMTINTATPAAFGAAPATATVGAATATSSATASPPFGAKLTTPAAAASPSMFGGVALPTAVTSGGNIFGGIAKPEQSVFGSPTAAASPPPVGLFAAAAAANPSPFGSTSPTAMAAASGGSLFGGGGAVGFGKPAAVGGGSIFGGAANNTPFGAANSPGSIFGDAAKPAEGANLFGSPAQPGASAASGGSMFGQNVFGQQAQSGSNIFGGSSSSQPAAATGAFGSGGSIFGGGAASPTSAASGGSIFGGASQGSALAPSVFGGGSSGFGSFASPTAAPVSAFGSPSGGSGGAFAQGGGAGSVAQTGFGSPQIGSSAFAKPLFGGTPSFGSPPAFGAQPSFGGAPTFGTPKGFGFGSPTAATPGTAAFSSPPTQKNNLFEALGSTDQGPSFGNLAQTTSNAQKPSFGGSSFMNYRA